MARLWRFSHRAPPLSPQPGARGYRCMMESILGEGVMVTQARKFSAAWSRSETLSTMILLRAFRRHNHHNHLIIPLCLSGSDPKTLPSNRYTTREKATALPRRWRRPSNLPFPLSVWKHRHSSTRSNAAEVNVDMHTVAVAAMGQKVKDDGCEGFLCDWRSPRHRVAHF